MAVEQYLQLLDAETRSFGNKEILVANSCRALDQEYSVILSKESLTRRVLTMFFDEKYRLGNKYGHITIHIAFAVLICGI